jgi:hypothetical protein
MQGGRTLPSNRANCESPQRRSLGRFETAEIWRRVNFLAGQAILVRPGDRDARHERRLSPCLLMLNPGHPERDGFKDQQASHGDMTIRKMRRRKLKTSTRTVWRATLFKRKETLRMKWIQSLTAVVALLGMNASADAGLFSSMFGGGGKCGAAKSCGCAPTCQPRCCKPTIARPCCGTTFEYQRKVSTQQAPCCKPGNCCPAKPSCCAPAASACAPKCGADGGACAPACAPKGANCAAPCASNCAPACAPKASSCAAPCASACAPACAPKAANCAAPCAPACGPKGADCAAPCASKCAPACAPKGANCAAPCASACAPACGPKGADCAAPCASSCAPACGAKGACCGDDRCCADACEIAELIYTSQTACYAKHRAKAIDKLGDKFNCNCNPEIMAAFVYALNDCDERVRGEAADEIGDQVRRNGCCCMCNKTVEALTAALADCDRNVRNEAEEALELCGYEVVDCCKPSCGAACGSACGPKCGACAPAGPACSPSCHAPEATPAAPAPMQDNGVAPAPPEEKSARSLFPIRRNNKLSNLFGLLN